VVLVVVVKAVSAYSIGKKLDVPMKKILASAAVGDVVALSSLATRDWRVSATR
jgi:hypothetical protein